MMRAGLGPAAVAAIAGRFPRGVAIVDLDAIAHNVNAIRREIGPTANVVCVVKANGYGHGAAPVAIAALQAGASGLAVACVDEGIQLRRAGIAAPVLLLGATPPSDMERLVGHRLTPTVCDREAVEALQAAAASAGRARTPMHIKVDAGLHRFGVEPTEAGAFVAWAAAQPRLRLEALYTHFSSAEEADGEATRREHGRFQAIVAELAARGIRPALHAANSAATTGFPELRLDMVRPGLATYGLAGDYPGAGALALRPALEIHSRIVRVHTVPAGEALGYGRTFIAAEPRRVALVSIGYGDGYPRALGNRGQALVNGRRAPVIGRVSMDQIVVDVTDLGPVAPGDLATLVGHQGRDAITAGEVAGWVDTISYELVTGLAPRLPRAYVRHGQLVGVADLLGERDVADEPCNSAFRWPAASAARALSGS
jgi:alanine racemase